MPAPVIGLGVNEEEWNLLSWDVIRGTLLALASSSHAVSQSNSDKEAVFTGYKDGYGDAAHNFDQVKRGEWGSLIERLHQARALAGDECVKENLPKAYTESYLTAMRTAIAMAFAEKNRTDSESNSDALIFTEEYYTLWPSLRVRTDSGW